MSVIFHRIAKAVIFSFLFTISLFVCASNSEEGKVLISEIVASNTNGLKDQFNNYSDWIEIHNRTNQTVNLNGWTLTDNKKEISKWAFPSIDLAPNGFLVVIASGKNITQTSNLLHTNFSLSADGEYLALFNNKGEFVSGFTDNYPIQFRNISYAYVNGEYEYNNTPTPWNPNSADEFIAPPEFTNPRGIYTSSFNLELNTTVTGAIIKYTIDGSEPGQSNGTTYTTPLKVDKTIVLRATTVKGNKTSSSVTNSYIFVADVLKQPALPLGYPSTWGKGVPADYEMDQEITNDPISKAQIIEAFNTLPIVSIVSKPSNFFSNENSETNGGIYVFTNESWERPVSFEIIKPYDDKTKQVNCGIQIQGGASRTPTNSPKHSFRLVFKSEYGPSKLDYSIFEEKDAAKSFNSISLKAGYNNSWIHWDSQQRNQSQYMRDVWSKNTFREMGNIGFHTLYINLFINGLYWGLYDISEQVDGDFMESYQGGDALEYDVLKDNEGASAGTTEQWDEMMNIARSGLSANTNYFKLQGKNVNGTINAAYPVYLDVASLSDYMILNFYGANQDWDHHNWAAARRKGSESKGFQFFVWDSERILEDVQSNIQNKNNLNCPSELFQALKKNTEFKVLFGDRVHKHLVIGGALTPDSIIQNWENRAETIRPAVYAESARWGDYRKDVDPRNPPYPLYTINTWEDELKRLTTDYFPFRTYIVLNQFITEGLYPSIAAPIFNKYKGEITSNFDLAMNAPLGDIYYSMGEDDPRMIGGGISPKAQKYSAPVKFAAIDSTVKARALSGGKWSALTEAHFVKPKPVYFAESEIKTYFIRNYPNPVKNKTNIVCCLPEGGNIQMVVVSMQGKVVQQIDLGKQQPGNFTYSYDASQLTNGIYLYKIKSGGVEYISKMIVAR